MRLFSNKGKIFSIEEKMREPMFVFVLDAELLPFKYHNPAFAVLFQAPPTLSTVNRKALYFIVKTPRGENPLVNPLTRVDM